MPILATDDWKVARVRDSTCTGTWKTEPPLNSMPRLSPRSPNASAEISSMMAVMEYHTLRRAIKSIWKSPV